jgi:hypothetical protein
MKFYGGKEKMRRFGKLTLVLLLLLSAVPLFAQSTLQATAETDRTKANLGDVIRYTLTVIRQGDMSQPPSIVLPSFEGFRVSGSYTNSMMNFINGAASAQNQQIVDLIAVKSGEITIDPAKIRFMNQTTKKYENLETKAITVTIGQGKRPPAAAAVIQPTAVPTVAAALPTPDIRSIKFSYTLDLGELMPYIIAAILFLVAMYYLWRRFFGKKKEVLAPVVIEDIRKNALKKLKKAKEKFEDADKKEYYSEMYEIVREFLNSHLKNTFNELTTQEIIKKLGELNAAQKDRDSCFDFMKECDLVKFADYTPSDAEAAGTMKKAEELITNFL